MTDRDKCLTALKRTMQYASFAPDGTLTIIGDRVLGEAILLAIGYVLKRYKEGDNAYHNCARDGDTGRENG